MLTEAGRYVFQFLLEGEVIQLLADGELAVHALLRDIEVLDVEEAILARGLDESLRKLLLALGCGQEREVESDEVRPVEVLL